jgi:hypothetical protein
VIAAEQNLKLAETVLDAVRQRVDLGLATEPQLLLAREQVAQSRDFWERHCGGHEERYIPVKLLLSDSHRTCVDLSVRLSPGGPEPPHHEPIA